MTSSELMNDDPLDFSQTAIIPVKTELGFVKSLSFLRRLAIVFSFCVHIEFFLHWVFSQLLFENVLLLILTFLPTVCRRDNLYNYCI